jgi:hypothetical protein
LKQNKRGTRDVAQVIEFLPRKHKALSSNANNARKKSSNDSFQRLLLSSIFLFLFLVVLEIELSQGLASALPLEPHVQQRLLLTA